MFRIRISVEMMKTITTMTMKRKIHLNQAIKIPQVKITIPISKVKIQKITKKIIRLRLNYFFWDKDRDE